MAENALTAPLSDYGHQAMVISHLRGGIAAPGFFDCAAQFGRFSGDATAPDARVFHAAEFSVVFALWVPPSEAPLLRYNKLLASRDELFADPEYGSVSRRGYCDYPPRGGAR